MKSEFTVNEVAEMLDLKRKEVLSEMRSGHLGFTMEDDKQIISLYDLEKYMGEDHTRLVVDEYLSDS